MFGLVLAAVFLLLCTPAAVVATTDAECRTCHVKPDYTSENLHHRFVNEKGYACNYCHKMIPDGSGGYIINDPTICSNCHINVDHIGAHNMLATAPDCISCHTHSGLDEHLDKTLGRESTCFTCHLSTRPEVQAAIAAGKGPAGTQVTCLNCHVGDLHIPQHDRMINYSNCEQCHTQGPLQVHLRKNVACSACHSSANQAIIDTIAAGRSGQDVACNNCHGHYVDHNTPHDKTPLPAGCSQCHYNTGLPYLHLNIINQANWCVICHESTNPVVIAAIQNGKDGGVTCATCHIGFADHIPTHDNISPQFCLPCHNRGPVYEHTTRTTTCVGCHHSQRMEVWNAFSKGRAGLTLSCLECHTGANHVPQHDHLGASPECTPCHTKTVLDEHMLKNSKCDACHTSAKPSVQQAIIDGKSGTDVNCKTCHGDWNHPRKHTDDRIYVPYGDCYECHASDFSQLHAAVDCLLCHKSSNAAVEQGFRLAYENLTVSCSECHRAINGFGDHWAQHDVVTMYTGCTNCHWQYRGGLTGLVNGHARPIDYWRPPTGCNGCHKSENPAVLRTIEKGKAREVGASNSQVTCWDCHNQGHWTKTGNQPPIAIPEADQIAYAGEPVRFSGLRSYDPEGNPVSDHFWDFGDGTQGNGATITHTYTEPGTYNVYLGVSDGSARMNDYLKVTVLPTRTATLFADQALQVTGLTSATGNDTATAKDITPLMRDGNLAETTITVSKSKTSNNVLATKIAKEALDYQQVTLRLYVSSLPAAQTIRIYPYKSDGTAVETLYSVSATVSTTGWVNIDVSSLAARMYSFGWMKFRIVNTTTTLTVSEADFYLVRQGGI